MKNLIRNIAISLCLRRGLVSIANEDESLIAVANAHGGDGVFAIAEDEGLFVPYGEYRHAKGLQKFTRAAATRMANAFNSLPAKIGRKFFGGVPIYLGHPDVPGRPDTNPAAPAQGWVESISVENDGMRLAAKWGDDGRRLITNGAFRYHSPHWLLRKVAGGLEPVQLLSVGLTNNPRIPVPAIANDAEPEPNNKMNKEHLELLGLEPGANDEAVEAAIKGLKENADKTAAAENDLAAEKRRADDAEAKLAGKSGELKTAGDKLTAANDAIATARGIRVDTALDALVVTGKVTRAERKDIREQLVALENDDDLTARLEELGRRRPPLKQGSKTGDLGGAKKAIAAENGAALKSEKRQEAIKEELDAIANDVTDPQKRYDTAWQRAERKHPELFGEEQAE